MATATALYAAEKSSTKPARAMTHPLHHSSKGNGRKQKVKQGEPFDPEELSRRLNAHILEQKLKSEKRRAAKAMKVATEAAGQDDGGYHHVPKVAASAFERTTTQDSRRKGHSHKLAENTIKAHREVPIEDSAAGKNLTLLQKTQIADRQSMEREVIKGRNNFQWDHDLEVAHEEDVGRGLYEPPQRTFHTDFAHLKPRDARGESRPLSMGDVFWEELELPQPKKLIPTHHTSNDRTDWVQRDNEGVKKKKDRTSPLLKKMESSWILMSKRPKASSHRDEAVAGIADLDSPPEIKQSFKGSFLARFKKQPS